MSELRSFVLAVSLLVAWFFVFYFRNKKRAKMLLAYFRGRCSVPIGDVLFSYRSFEFRLARIASGGGQTGVGGSYPVLSMCLGANVDSTLGAVKIIFGHSECGRYTRGGFLILPPHSMEDLAGKKYLFGSSDEDVRTRFKNVAADGAVDGIVNILFNKDFHHLTVGPEIYVSGIGFKRQNLVSYIGLPEDIYDKPELLESYLNSLIGFCAVLNIVPKK